MLPTLTHHSPSNRSPKSRHYNTYRFGFNGQETDNEIAGIGNINAAEFWEYDARLGRRWNVDISPFTAISFYACFVNNPIVFNDILGNVIGGDREKVEKVKKSSQDYIESLTKEINSLNEQLSSNKLNKKERIGIQNQIGELETKRNEFRTVLDEIKELEEDNTTEYYIKTIDGSSGSTSYNSDIRRIEITTDGSVELTAHELKHGHQYFKGEINFLTGGAKGYLCDINDEFQAYSRQYLFDPNSLGFLLTVENIRLQTVDEGQPYLSLPGENLTKNTLMKEISLIYNISIPSGAGPMMFKDAYMQLNKAKQILHK
ncbi:MAG: hypothetical protein CFE21_13650 [Bacteroidetes bacterium B1(2017)]|nr:MAG: hypothetical protein CFE21_13650 [Bacteroidetes bacterium B1(2017)]